MTISDLSSARTEAGVRAVGDARQRAARLADAAGVRLGRVLSIAEGPLVQGSWAENDAGGGRVWAGAGTADTIRLRRPDGAHHRHLRDS